MSTSGQLEDVNWEISTTGSLTPEQEMAFVMDSRLNRLKKILFFIDICLPPIIAGIGLIGNALSYVLMMQAHYQHSINCFYMRCIAISDSLFLITTALQRWLLTLIPDVLTAPNVRKPFCLQFMFFFGFCITLSSYLLLVMSGSRLLALLFPFRSKQWCTIFKARLSLLVVVCIALAIHLPSFWRSKRKKYETWICPYHFKHDILYLTMSGLTSIYVSAVLLFVINVAIIITIKRSNDKRKELGGQDNKEKDKSITKMLITVSTTYLVCLVPRRIQAVIFKAWQPTYDEAFWKMVDRLTLDLSIIFEYCSFSLNAYLYVLVCGRFRKELKRILWG